MLASVAIQTFMFIREIFGDFTEVLLFSYLRKRSFQYVTKTLAKDCYRSFATTLYLTGTLVTPTVPS